MGEEQPPSLHPSTPSPSAPPPTLRTHFVSFGLFLFLLTPLLLFGSGCPGCNCSPFPSSGSASTTGLVAVRAANVGEASLFLDVLATGVLTPTGDGHIIADGETEPAAVDLNLLAAEGYVGVRVPHAPPTYTVSTIMAGMSPGAPGAHFRYFSPPTNPIATTVPVTLTRRPELEPALNARFPITDGRSHWEVWWLPDGAALPLPDGPFRLVNEFPAPFSFEFQADFGEEAVDSCSGCPFQYVVFDGATLLGPFDGAVVYGNDQGRPLALFGTHCTHFPPDAVMINSVLLAPSQPYTFTFCLENYDTFTQTFAVDITSEQSWAYTFHTQAVVDFGGQAPPAVPVGSAPFQVQVSGATEFDPGMLVIHAVGAPTFTVGASIRETLQVGAQSTLSPTMRADTAAVGFSMQFDPQLNAERKTYLPTITKE